MTSLLAERPVLRGAQSPSLLSVPEFSSSTGAEAVEVAAMVGLVLDPWQQFVLHNALGEGADGKWAAFEVAVEVARQNGKGGILEARELAGLFVLGERLIIHSAHEFATSLEAFRRLEALVADTPDFSRRVKRVSRAHGEEGIELKGGQRIRFRTRTKGGGRGFSCDCLILDEAMVVPEAMHGALLPTLSARENPQVWYTGSAVDQESMEHGLVFARVRERALKGDDPSLAYFGWSADATDPEMVGEMATDPQTWARANPGLGIRISLEHVEREQRSMDPRTFAVERLGVGDWPQPYFDANAGISIEAWNACHDPHSEAIGSVCFAFDVRPNRSSSSICVAGVRPDGERHVEVIDHRPGTGWVVERLMELVSTHQAMAVMYDQAGPAASLAASLSDLGVNARSVSAREHAQGCGLLYDAVEQRTVHHLGTGELSAAVRGAIKRPLGDAWAWSRRASTVDISPLVACTLALFGVEQNSVWDGPLLEVFG